MESNNIDYEEHEKHTLFTLKNLVMGLGILAALGLATAGSLRLLRSGSKSAITSEQGDEGNQNEISNSNQNRDLSFDEISSSTPYWIPFYAHGSPYGIIPKQVDNTCTLLSTEGSPSFSGSNPKLSIDGKTVYVYDSTSKTIKLLDLDTKTYLSDGIIWACDKYFAVIGEYLFGGGGEYLADGETFISKIRKYHLNLIKSGIVKYEPFRTKCKRNQLAHVLATTNDGSKVFYACEDNGRKNRIYLKDFGAGEDFLVNDISETPDWFLISPDERYTVHIEPYGNKTIELCFAQDGSHIYSMQLGANFDYPSIKNVAFSADGKYIHIINVKDNPRKKEATISTIDFEKFLHGNIDFLGEPLPIEFPRS